MQPASAVPSASDDAAADPPAVATTTAAPPAPAAAAAAATTAAPSVLVVAAAMLLYCVSGTLLTLVNKLAVLVLPLPHTLLLFQNGVTVALLLAISAAAPSAVGGPLPPLTAAVARDWLPLTLLFVGMLASSLLALQAVSAVTLIVVRNLGTLVVAFFERIVLGTQISTLTVGTLVGILLGTAIYGLYDLQFSAVGYAWLVVNIACTAAFQIYAKGLIAGLPKSGPGALGPFGMSYYNNIISLPVFAAIVLATHEHVDAAALVSALTPVGWATVTASALLGFTLSTSAFLVNTLVSATSMMVANNVNKFALIIISELAVEATLGPLAATGTALVMLSAWLYVQSKGSWATGWLHSTFDSLGTPRLLGGLGCLFAVCVLAWSIVYSETLQPAIFFPAAFYNKTIALRTNVTQHRPSGNATS